MHHVGKTFVILAMWGVAISARSQSFQPTVIYDGAELADIDGGIRRGSTYLGALRLGLTFTRAQTSAYVEVLNTHGGNPSDLAGDAQGVSSLAAPSRTRIEEGWIQKNFFRSQLSILIGRYDLNTEFYRLQSAGLFLNSSFGVGPEFSGSGSRGPSIYPNTTFAVRAAYRPAKNLVARVAAFDGMVLGELALLSRPSRDIPRDIRFRLGRFAALPAYRGKVSLGTWRYTDSRHSSGVYLLGDQTLHESGPRKLSAFGQFGIGDARTERFSRYFGGGIVIAAPFAAREKDEAGFAVAAAAPNHSKAETTLEWTYLTPLNAHVAVQPDVQYVIHPSASRTNNALVVALRFELSL